MMDYVYKNMLINCSFGSTDFGSRFIFISIVALETGVPNTTHEETDCRSHLIKNCKKFSHLLTMSIPSLTEKFSS